MTRAKAGSAEAGSGGIFENLALSVADMRGDLWIVSGPFGMVCNGFRRAYARELRIPPSPPATQSHPTFRSGQILTTRFSDNTSWSAEAGISWSTRDCGNLALSVADMSVVLVAHLEWFTTV